MCELFEKRYRVTKALLSTEYDTPYKLFLASMIVATKYIEDYKSHASSIYKIVSPLYSSKDLNEMERSFLGVLKVFVYCINAFELPCADTVHSLISLWIYLKWIVLLINTKSH